MTSDQPRHRHMVNSIAKQFEVAAVLSQPKAAKRHAGRRAKELDQRGADEIAGYIDEFEHAESRMLPKSAMDFDLPSGVPVFPMQPGKIDQQEVLGLILDVSPDCVAVFGTGLIKDDLLDTGLKFINIHLSLLPWYRGTGGSFWPFFYDEPEYVGVTVFYLDLGIDSGPIIHQALVNFEDGDWIHEGSVKAIVACIDLQVQALGELAEASIVSHVQDLTKGKTFYAKDLTIEELHSVREKWTRERMDRYIIEQDEHEKRVEYIQ